MPKNVLMICYYYPPLTDVGCKRSVAFAKYLKKHGWNPVVLSVKNPDKAYCSFGEDSEIPPQIPVERSYSIINPYKLLGRVNGVLFRILKLFNINLSRNYFYDLFCIPDIFAGWIPLTVIKARRMIKRLDIDTVYVSCTPLSSAVIGSLLKIITRTRLVVDFRDPYALNIKWLEHVVSVPGFRKKIDRKIAAFVLKRSDAFIVTSKETGELYIEQYPQVTAKIHTIHNGFDEAFHSPDNAVEKYKKFTIIYTGQFYLYALKSEAFFKALAILKKAGKINKNNFQFIFYGGATESINSFAEKYGIEDIVLANNRIPYRDVLNEIRRSHLQLLRIVKPMISTKLFEGIPLNIPFLATIPNGEVEGIIKKYSPSSFITDPDSPTAIADAMESAMDLYHKGQIQNNLVNEFLEDFSREKQTLKLIDILENHTETDGMR